MAISETTIANRALSRIGEKRLSTTLGATDTVTKKQNEACEDAYELVRDEVIRAVEWNCLKKRTVLKDITVVGVDIPNDEVDTFTDHNLAVDDRVTFYDIEGTVELNGETYRVASVPTTKSLTLKDETTGAAIDFSAFTAYTGPGDGTDEGRLGKKPEFGYDRQYDLPSDYFRALEIEETQFEWVVEGTKLLTNHRGDIEFRYIGHPKARTATDPEDQNYDAMLLMTMSFRLAAEIARELSQSQKVVAELWELYEGKRVEAQLINISESSAMRLLDDTWILSRR